MLSDFGFGRVFAEAVIAYELVGVNVECEIVRNGRPLVSTFYKLWLFEIKAIGVDIVGSIVFWLELDITG